MSAVAVQRNRPRRSVLASVWAFVKRNVLTVYSILFFVYLLLPIAVVGRAKGLRFCPDIESRRPMWEKYREVPEGRVVEKC